ncbi:MAG: thioredoxin family protein, partial [Bacteroidetes bacterium]|nr:thioredoxin family protein [Bacteroidota bacterium]
GPCKLLKKNTFTSEKVGTAVNKSFVSIDVDAEKGEGISLSKKYEVKAHPLILIINPEGKVVKRILGYRTDAQLLSELKGLLK